MTMISETKRVKSEDDITDEVLRRFDVTQDARLREVMQSLVKHLHAFAREVQLTEKEWFAGIEFLTAVGKKCAGNRQEFILLSDTLGLSILVDKLNHQFPGSATETTVLGPFYRPGAQELPPGGNMATIDRTGTPLLITGRVVDDGGKPIAERGARLLAGDVGRFLRLADGRRRRTRHARRLSHRQRRPLPGADDETEVLPGAHRRSRRRHAASDRPAPVPPRSRPLHDHRAQAISRW